MSDDLARRPRYLSKDSEAYESSVMKAAAARLAELEAKLEKVRELVDAEREASQKQVSDLTKEAFVGSALDIWTGRLVASQTIMSSILALIDKDTPDECPRHPRKTGEFVDAPA